VVVAAVGRERRWLEVSGVLVGGPVVAPSNCGCGGAIESVPNRGEW
jgi:hypothetical protein